MGVASPSIENLEAAWRSIFELCDGLSEEEWKRPTGCPGWTVQDNVSHLVDYEATALGKPRPDHTAPEGEHVKNELGAGNEVGVDVRRGRPGSDVLAELREISAERSAQLRKLTAEDLGHEVTTPAGPGTLADMLRLRVMDTWSHEQDIRRALGRPGHVSGPVAEEAVAYFSQYLPFVVGKRAGAPDGSTAFIVVGDIQRTAIGVSDGRAQVLDLDPDEPTVTVEMPVATFAALVGGRSDAPDDVVITGDAALGRRIVAALGFMP